MTKDGHRRLLSWSNTILYDTAGHVTHVVGIAQDVTEQRHAEEALKAAQERLQLALEGSNMGVWDWNIATNTAYLSSGYKQMLGYEPDELPNAPESWFHNIHPDDVPRVQQVLQDYLKGRTSTYELEHRLRHKSGMWLCILSRGKVVARDEHGQPTRMAGTITDITARKRTEDELRIFQAMFENASDPIAIMRTSDGTITHYNAAYRRQYRCGDQHLEKPMSVTIASQDQRYLPGILRQTQEQGIWQGYLTHERQDRTTFPALVSCFTIKDNLGNVVSMVSIVRDITSVIAAQQQLRHMALHDGLTGLPNRSLFYERLNQALEKSENNPEKSFVVLLLDVDDFKRINDSLGHIAGDQLLIELACRLRRCVRTSDTIARLGGDEFAMLVEDMKDIDAVIHIAERNKTDTGGIVCTRGARSVYQRQYWHCV